MLVGAQRHVTVDRALRLLGLGAPEVVAADDQGRMDVTALREALRAGDGPTIVCAQAGEVNTGAFDPFDEIADAAAEHGAWLHVDGAFGLWAATSPRLRHLVAGAERADSWITDAHKWLNVPYDSALVLCADAGGSSRSNDGQRVVSDPGRHACGARPGRLGTGVLAARARVRRLRRVAAPRTERAGRARRAHCDCARRFADGIAELEGVEVLNEVVLNQVLFRFDTDERTDRVLHAVQEAGDVWMSGTTWDGRRAIRISVSNWQTTDAEIDLALEAFRTASQSPAHAPAR